MKRTLVGGLFAAATLLGGLALTSTPASAIDDEVDQIAVVPDDRVCDQPPAHQPPVPSTTKTMLLIAPEGKVIVATCVKAGSAIQGEGPDYKTYGEGVASVTISHPSGKDISHYTVTYADKPPTEVKATATHTAPKCDAVGTVVLSDAVGYTWSNEGTDLARTYTATATAGYKLTGQTVYGPFRLSKTTEGCATSVVSQPTPPPTPAVIQVSSQSPVVPPAAAAPAAVVAATPIATQLPATGSSSWVTALIALVTLLGGTGLVRLSRRPTD